MNDDIQSLPSIEAIETINQTKNNKGGVRWTEYVSNKPEALRCIEQGDWDELKEVNRVLGQKWNKITVCFLMKTLEQFPRNASDYTQSKMFSLASTIFDLLGILSPLTTRIKKLLQQVWKLGKKWDEPLHAELHSNQQECSIVTLQCLISKSQDGLTIQQIRKTITSFMSLLMPQLLHWQQLLSSAPKNRTKSFKHLFSKVKTA